MTAVWSATNKVKIELDISRDIDQLSDPAAIHIFRIVQEGLTNVAKHANATRVWLHIGQVSTEDTQETNDRAIKLTIDDDGNGRSRLISSEMSSGMGIINMQERVTALGGSISFGNRQNSGFRVLVVIPVETAYGRVE